MDGGLPLTAKCRHREMEHDEFDKIFLSTRCVSLESDYKTPFPP